MVISREATQAKLDLRSAAAARFKPKEEYTIADRLEAKVAAVGARPLLIHGERVLSYDEVNARSNQVAHAAAALGLERGDVCALAMENRPEFFIIWFGLNKIGVTAALLNTHNRGRPLRHAIDESGAKAVIVGEECLPVFDSPETRDLLEKRIDQLAVYKSRSDRWLGQQGFGSQSQRFSLSQISAL